MPVSVDDPTVGAFAPAVPAQLGRYQVLRHLASGGMADVLLACDPNGKHVVLKRIREDSARDDKLVRMFLGEAKLAAALHHPNIVEVYDSGEDAGEYFFAMEYIHGEDLRKMLAEVHRRDDQLPIAQVLSIIGAAASGLHYAHEARSADGHPLGLVHRDVSLANILVGYDGRVLVTDFGVAKATLYTAETRSGTLKGKVSYMSPEQVTGRQLDRRSDVFSLGIVFYELVTARRLFKGDNDFLTMSAIVMGDIPPPSQQRVDVPRPVEAMIMKALQTNPKHRYATCEELRGEIETFTKSIGLVTSPAGIADHMVKLFGRRPLPWLVDDDEPTQTGFAIDFDGSESGVVAPPATARVLAMEERGDAAPSSPLAIARSEAVSFPPPRTSAVHRAEPEIAAPSPAVSLAPRRFRALWIGGGLGAIAIAAVIAVGMRGGSDDAPAARSPDVAPRPSTVATPEPPVAAPQPARQPMHEPAPEAEPPAPAPTPTPAVAPAAEPTAPIARPAVAKHDSRVRPKKRDARVKPTGDKAPSSASKPAWDPNALFAPK